jgi:hypothetical protein
VDAGAGQRYVPILFTNAGTAPCTLRGFPGVAGLDAAGRQVMQAGRASSGVAPITLTPGATAHSVVHSTAIPSGTATACAADYVALLITPPGLTTSVRRPVSLPSCGFLTVTAVAAGKPAG